MGNSPSILDGKKAYQRPHWRNKLHTLAPEAPDVFD
jgi:hypothetical protein